MGILRLILALSVVLQHAELPRLINSTVAVKFFFVISGFYMALVLDGKYAEGKAGAVAFYKARLLRLLPTYWVSLLLGLGALALTIGSAGFYSTLASGWQHLAVTSQAFAAVAQATPLGQGLFLFLKIGDGGQLAWSGGYLHLPPAQQAWTLMLNPPAWSLSTELLFYACAPWLLRQRTGLLVVVVVATFLARFAVARYVPVLEDPWTYRFFPFEIGVFVSGSLAYRFYKANKDRLKLDQPWAPYAVAACILVLIAMQKLPYRDVWLAYLMAPVVAMLFTLTKNIKWDRAVGELSYPVYILHWPILNALIALRVPHAGLAAIIVTVVFSFIVFKYLETPIEAIRQKLSVKAATA